MSHTTGSDRGLKRYTRRVARADTANQVGIPNDGSRATIAESASLLTKMVPSCATIGGTGLGTPHS